MLEEILLTWEDHYLRVIDANLNKEVNSCLLALNMANLPSGEQSVDGLLEQNNLTLRSDCS